MAADCAHGLWVWDLLGFLGFGDLLGMWPWACGLASLSPFPRSQVLLRTQCHISTIIVLALTPPGGAQEKVLHSPFLL